MIVDNKAVTFKGLEIDFMLSDNIEIVAKIAKDADAKFGLPKVEIIELYGLFHCTKSRPLI